MQWANDSIVFWQILEQLCGHISLTDAVMQNNTEMLHSMEKRLM